MLWTYSYVTPSVLFFRFFNFHKFHVDESAPQALQRPIEVPIEVFNRLQPAHVVAKVCHSLCIIIEAFKINLNYSLEVATHLRYNVCGLQPIELPIGVCNPLQPAHVIAKVCHLSLIHI